MGLWLIDVERGPPSNKFVIGGEGGVMGVVELQGTEM
jgi:hypothetical protein